MASLVDKAGNKCIKAPGLCVCTCVCVCVCLRCVCGAAQMHIQQEPESRTITHDSYANQGGH